MKNETAVFDAAATPLCKGVTLVEASAGTGKTFAISMLVLRGVVDLGIELRKILVVTYTVAATEELRGRIRSRLIQARKQFLAPDSRADEVLSRWLNTVDDTAEALRRLELALLDIDAMGIFTIHGFCQRILAEQVLESGHFFDTDLLTDTLLQRNELIRDFWRTRLYEIDPRYGSLILGRYPTPSRLYESIKGAENPSRRLLPDTSDQELSCRELDSAAELLRSWWLAHRAALELDLAEADRRGLLNKDLARGYRGWLEAIQHSFSEDRYPDPGTVGQFLPENLVQGINGTKVRGPEKKAALVAGWSLPADHARRYLAAIDRLLLSVRVDLAVQLRSEIPRWLRKQGMVSFDELILDLARAIGSVAGKSLVRQVGCRYSMALIDEFQDTDAAQYTIFSELFGQGRHYQYLIGDPKQAIYRFRGADIHSYLEARKQVDQRLTLDCNYRSNPGLVTAANRLLDGFEIGGSPYQPVRSPQQSAAGRLTAQGKERPNLIFCQLENGEDQKSGWGATAAEEAVRSWVVSEAQRLIHPQSELRIASTGPGSDTAARRINPSDIGILVRTNSQAEQFFNAFSRLGVPAVLSSRRAVFHTREAEDLLLVLQAVAAPSDTVLLRTALSRDWFGLDGSSLYRLCSDDKLFNRCRERFHHYHRCWIEAGPLLMMNQLLEGEKVFLNLSGYARAERRITNIQHLIELLQQQQGERRLTTAQTLAWFQEKLADPGTVQEAELRLESDGEAINVITMHSAKGLEYEIVFCPFLYRSSLRASLPPSIDCYDPSKGRIFDLGSELFDHHARLSRAEEIDEEMRLAYVAMTRARLRTYLIWADIRATSKSDPGFESALGRILFAEGRCSYTEQQGRLQQLGAAEHCRYRLAVPEQDHIYYEAGQPDGDMLQAEKYDNRRLQTSRIRTSFSGLTMLTSHHGEDTNKAGDERGAHQGMEKGALPAGVRFGNLVHEALETFDFAALADGRVEAGEVEQLVARYRYDIDYGAAVLTLLQNTVTTPLTAPDDGSSSFSLASIPADRQVKEMEFSLHLDPLSTALFNDILRAEPTFSALAARDIEGYLNGFVDLIIEYGDRYYVVDYKTNKLGSEGSYGRDGLLRAMKSHNYGLQYWIYTLVVHRCLKNWVSGYRYQDHFGGVMYLFVRGMEPGIPGSGVFFERPGEAPLMALDNCFGGTTPCPTA